MFRPFFALVVWAFVLLACAAPSLAAVTAAQRTALLKLDTLATRATNLVKLGRLAEGAAAVKEGYEAIAKVAEGADADVVKAATPILERFKLAHSSLELEGYELPAPPKLEAAAAAVPGTKPVPGVPAGAPAPAALGVSFVKEVAPFLVAKCGRCHVSDAKGKFSAATYEALAKSGMVSPPGGILLEKIESGDMPRGGAKVEAAELAMLKKWLAEGAKFDGADLKANLTALTPATAPVEPAKVEVAAATGKESILFSRDLAPVLVENCLGCHGENNPRQNLSFATFAQLLRGGDSGPPLVPTRPADSLLVKKLLGTASGERMPMGKPALAADVIAKFEKWITEGARFDGPDQGLDLRQLAAVALAKAAPHEKLADDRKIAALKNWRLGNPGEELTQHETTNFLVVGNLPAALLADIGQQSEAVGQKVAAQFKHPAGQPLIKGKMTLFVFNKRYDYTEFGQMVEKQAIPPTTVAHWRYNAIEAYACLLAPREDPSAAAAALAPQIAGVYIASRGAPRWFAEGAGRLLVARLDTRSPLVAAWQTELPQAVSRIKKVDDLLSGSGESAGLAAYAFCQFLATSSSRYQALLAAVGSSGDFEGTFAKNYGGTPTQVAGAWLSRAAQPGNP